MVFVGSTSQLFQTLVTLIFETSTLPVSSTLSSEVKLFGLTDVYIAIFAAKILNKYNEKTIMYTFNNMERKVLKHHEIEPKVLPVLPTFHVTLSDSQNVEYGVEKALVQLRGGVFWGNIIPFQLLQTIRSLGIDYTPVFVCPSMADLPRYIGTPDYTLSGIYLIIGPGSLTDNSIRGVYVGSSSDIINRAMSHANPCSQNVLFQNISKLIQAYGPELFQFVMVQSVSPYTPSLLLRKMEHHVVCMVRNVMPMHYILLNSTQVGDDFIDSTVKISETDHYFRVNRLNQQTLHETLLNGYVHCVLGLAPYLHKQTSCYVFDTLKRSDALPIACTSQKVAATYTGVSLSLIASAMSRRYIPVNHRWAFIKAPTFIRYVLGVVPTGTLTVLLTDQKMKLFQRRSWMRKIYNKYGCARAW